MSVLFDHGGMTAAELAEALRRRLEQDLGVPAGACQVTLSFGETGALRGLTVDGRGWPRRLSFGRRQLDVRSSRAA